jgi:hypothetical protein
MDKISVKNQFPIIKHEFVEIQIPANTTQTRLYFPELPNLRNVHLLNIEVTYDGYIPFTPSNIQVINRALFQNTFLTLVDYTGKEFTHQIPLQYLNYMQQSANNFFTETLIKQFCGQRVNWTKSYIEFSSNTNVGNRLEACIFSVYYADTKTNEQKSKAANFNRMS